MEDRGYINWYEYGLVDDLLLVRFTPDMTKQESSTGIILTTAAPSAITDRPNGGEVVSRGPDGKYEVGTYVWFAPQASFDCYMILTEGEEKYLMIESKSVDAVRVPDVRELSQNINK